MLPAWQALVPDLVPRELVPGAVALNSAGFNVARALGPAIGGVLVAAAGPGSAFLVNAASFVAVLGAAAALPRPAFRDDAESSLVDAIALGVRYARYTAPFRWLLAVAAAFALTTSVIQALLPNLTDALGGDAAAYGLLLGAMGGGALVGAFTQQRVSHRAVAMIQRARGFDRADGPVTHHLVAVDVDPARRPGWERLVAVHERLHRQEGSGPVEGADRPADARPPRPAGARRNRIRLRSPW